MAYNPLSEPITPRHVQALWQEQHLFKDLISEKSEAIKIFNPGIFHEKDGIDFSNAKFSLNSKKIEGNVLVNLTPAHTSNSFIKDSKIDLQVFLMPSEKQTPDPNIPTVFLKDQLKIAISEIPKILDLEIYPSKKYEIPGKCSQKIFSTFSLIESKEFLKDFAFQRLEKKYNRLNAIGGGSLACAAAGIAAGLGYRKNASQFLNLFEALTPFQQESENELYALAIGLCGFFDTSFYQKYKTSPFYLSLLSIWEDYKLDSDPRLKLNLMKIRPVNHPLRRLAYLVKLIKDRSLDSASLTLVQMWKKNRNLPFSKLTKLLLEFIPDYTDHYWNHHYTFSAARVENSIALLGEDTKKEILFNTFLPIIFQEIKEDKNDEINHFINFYENFSQKPTHKSRYLSARFFMGAETHSCFTKTLYTQGAYQVFENYCQHFNAYCEGCPLISANSPTLSS